MADTLEPPKGVAKSVAKHPFAQKEPKPTRARLVGLLDPLGRRRYSEVERFLATVSGATSGLNFFENGWGWAVRYLFGPRDQLCTLHLLPNLFEATVPVAPALQGGDGAVLPSDLRRKIQRVRPANGVRWVRLPIKSDSDYANFQVLIRAQAEALRKPPPGKPKPAKDKPSAVAV